MKSKPSFNQLNTTRRLCCGFPKAAQGRQSSMFWSAVYDGWVGWGWVGEFLVEGGGRLKEIYNNLSLKAR